MYNRYIPQADGSYRRSRMPDAHRPVPQAPPPPPCPESVPEPPKHLPSSGQRHRTYRREPDTSISGFLKRLIPKDFDTGDLLIVILLLLMAGDCAEDQNSALLTLVLYFIM